MHAYYPSNVEKVNATLSKLFVAQTIARLLTKHV